MTREADADLILALTDYVVEAGSTYPVMQRLVLSAILEGYHKEAGGLGLPLPKALQKQVIAYFRRCQEQGALQLMEPAAVFQIIFGMARSYAIGKYVYKLKRSHYVRRSGH